MGTPLSESAETEEWRRYQLAARRGANIATVATARKLLTLVYHALRDGHVRALDAHPRWAKASAVGAPA